MAKPDKSRQELSLEQLNAIDLLVTGKSDREVAEVVGVSRQTVCGWRLYDPSFQAELNRRRKEVWGAAADRLRSLLPKALEVLERELDEGPNSWRAALKVLEMAGFAAAGGAQGVAAIGPDDPQEIVDAEIRRRQARELPDMIGGVNEHSRRAVVADLEARRQRTS
jgi:Homeodomain-like domain